MRWRESEWNGKSEQIAEWIKLNQCHCAKSSSLSSFRHFNRHRENQMKMENSPVYEKLCLFQFWNVLITVELQCNSWIDSWMYPDYLRGGFSTPSNHSSVEMLMNSFTFSTRKPSNCKHTNSKDHRVLFEQHQTTEISRYAELQPWSVNVIYYRFKFRWWKK